MSDEQLEAEAPPEAAPPQPSPAPDPGILDRFNAARNKFATAHNTIKGAEPIPQLSDPSQVSTLAPGKWFMTPDGQKIQKPWEPKTVNDLRAIGDGETYIHPPTGRVLRTPTYDPLDLTTQTLYDMTQNSKERRNALARVAGPDAVKTDPWGEMYVQTPDGKKLKPGRGALTGVATLGANAIPTVMGVGGAIAGLPAAPIVAGAANAAGRGINDAILALSGVYDRSATNEIAGLGFDAVTGMFGAGTGRIAGSLGAAVGASAPAFLNEGKGMGSRMAAAALGADVDPERTLLAQDLRGTAPESERPTLGSPSTWMRLFQKSSAPGPLVGPSSWMQEAPFLHFGTEVIDPALRPHLDAAGNKVGPTRASQMDYYVKNANEALDQLGVQKEGRESLVSPTAKVDTGELGQTLINKYKDDLTSADGALNAEMERIKAARTASLTGEATGATEALTGLQNRLSDTKKAAQNIVDEGFKSIQSDIDGAMKAADVGESPGDLARAGAEKFRNLRAGISSRAKVLYDAADVAAGDARPPIGDLINQATDLLQTLPDTFKSKYPDIVKKIEALGNTGSEDVMEKTATGSRLTTKEGDGPTFGQLHELRTLLRQDVDPDDLLKTYREGVYSKFAKGVDDALHQTSGNVRDANLLQASKMLDDADGWYSNNIKQFKDSTVDWLVKSTKAGIAPDPEFVAANFFKKNMAERIPMIREALGPALWAAAQQSHVQGMINSSLTTVLGKNGMPGVIDGLDFAGQVQNAVRNGVVKNAYNDALATKVTQQANRILAMNGKLPLEYIPGDDMASIMTRAAKLSDQIDHASKVDPLGTLTKDMKRIENDTQLQKDRRNSNDPLFFLNNANAGAFASADKILNNPDLMMAAAHRFGERLPNGDPSPEFEMLRQVAAHRLFQTANPENLMGKMAEMPASIQRLIFPGVSHEDAITLAKNMDFLMGARQTGAGQSIAATQHVTNPQTGLPLGWLGKMLLGTPLVRYPARQAMTAYYQGMTNFVNNPFMMEYVAKGLRSTPEEKDAAKRIFTNIMNARASGRQIGSAVGAAAGANVTLGADQ